MISRDIANAIMGNGNMDDAVNREVLKAGVMRRIMCPKTGVVLDVRTAVYFSVAVPGGKTGSEVVDGAAWDTMKDTVTAQCESRGITLEVIDGRILNAPRKRKG